MDVYFTPDGRPGIIQNGQFVLLQQVGPAASPASPAPSVRPATPSVAPRVSEPKIDWHAMQQAVQQAHFTGSAVPCCPKCGGQPLPLQWHPDAAKAKAGTAKQYWEGCPVNAKTGRPSHSVNVYGCSR
jgi:hypothetical protein